MKKNTKLLVLSAMFLAIGIILPTITMHIPGIGRTLLPMHIPVLLCGFLCGGPYGAIIGFLLPLCNSILFGAPPMMPVAISMAVELLFYGFISGLLYKKLKNQKGGVYISLVLAMIVGRIVWGIMSYFLYGMLSYPFTIKIFFTQAVISGIPGIIAQFIIIPAIVISLKRINRE